MSTTPYAVAILSGPCAYCGAYHTGICPRVKAIEYHPGGSVKRVELHDQAVAEEAAKPQKAGEQSEPS